MPLQAAQYAGKPESILFRRLTLGRQRIRSLKGGYSAELQVRHNVLWQSNSGDERFRREVEFRVGASRRRRWLR